MASNRPEAFPGNDDVRGLRAVQMTIGNLIGRKLDGMVVVKLNGFVKLIDAIGGLDIKVPEAVYDHKYPLENGKGYVVVSIKKGAQHMNGHRALMYARSRHMDSDYGRMERQQIVLTALGKQILKEPLVVRLPELLEIAKDNLWTNLKTRDLGDLAALAENVDVKGMRKVRFIPPRYPSYLNKAEIKNPRCRPGRLRQGRPPGDADPRAADADTIRPLTRLLAQERWPRSMHRRPTSRPAGALSPLPTCRHSPAWSRPPTSPTASGSRPPSTT